MPYKCVHCSQLYKDGSEEILKGCNNCQSKFFFYIREEKLQEIERAKKNDENLELSNKEKRQIESDIRDIVGAENEDIPVFLDFESVKIIKPGKYLFDLQKLFERGKPQIYQIEDGKYVVDLTSYNREKEKQSI